MASWVIFSVTAFFNAQGLSSATQRRILNSWFPHQVSSFSTIDITSGLVYVRITYCTARDPIGDTGAFVAKIDLGHVCKISQDVFGLGYRYYTSIAVRICIHRFHLAREGMS